MSEIAQLRQQIENEYAAAYNGLNGLACVARHEFISARYRRIDQLHNQLAVHVGRPAATQIVSEISDKVVNNEQKETTQADGH